MTDQEKQAVEVAAQIAADAGGKVPYAGKPGTGTAPDDGLGVPDFLVRKPGDTPVAAKPDKLPVPPPKPAQQAASAAAQVKAGRSNVEKPGKPSKAEKQFAAHAKFDGKATISASVSKTPLPVGKDGLSSFVHSLHTSKAPEKPVGKPAAKPKGKAPGKGKKLAGKPGKAGAKGSAAKKPAKKPAVVSSALKPGTKNALLVDLITKAGKAGIPHETVCKKLGWVRCRVTARRLFDRIGVKLRIENGVFYAG